MGKADDDRCFFPLTSLQIGDLQSYLSDLQLFLAPESKKLYILVDNRPWLRDPGLWSAHLWQLMVTKSRLSPFAISNSRSKTRKAKKFERWFSMIDATTSSQKRRLLPVKKLRNSLFLSSDLHRTLYGFIVFEVAWNNVRGINYLNELQTDTSLVIEAKSMQRWEFDSIAQAGHCMPSWFSGTLSEQQNLKEYLDSAIGEVYYDAEENFSNDHCSDDEDYTCKDSLCLEDNFSSCLGSSFSVYADTAEHKTSEPRACPLTGLCKRRRVTKSIRGGVEVDFYSDETENILEDLSDNSGSHSNDSETAIEAKQYHDVLISFRFNDHDLPFRLHNIIMSDLRLLTLLEAGLPSWVIFLQSYPGFCHLYRPWMCPLARGLYVLISIITVLIGFYDLYKNVPVLKATASHFCGPLFDWIETWDMVSRIRYLGTMLFLHNFRKAVTWFLAVTHTTRSFFSVLTRPLFGPFVEVLGFLVPTWNMLIEVAESLCSIVWVVIESSSTAVGDLIEIIMWPMWLIISIVSSIVTSILYPVFWILWELIYAPVRVVLGLASFVSLICTWIAELISDIWLTVRGIVQLASASEATVSMNEVSMWRSLWNDLFSQVFRALRSILNGFVAFFMACNRHRLSIYNHIQDFIQRMLGRAPGSQPSDSRSSGPTQGTQSLSDGSGKFI